MRGMSGLHEECGVFGIVGGPQTRAARATYYGLYALQHRGQESAGIAVSTGNEILHHKAMGLVSEVFDEKRLATLPGSMACGHVRYSTSGRSLVVNAQPLVVRYRGGALALAHNGNLVNAPSLRATLEQEGVIFETSIDSELIANLVARADTGNIVEAVLSAMRVIRGAYALVIMTPDTLIGVRDPDGIRPLSIGRSEDSWMLASESCAFDAVGGTLVRDVEPGEVVTLNRSGVMSHLSGLARPERLCIFEFIYFGRPDSVMGASTMYVVRKRAGSLLAREAPARGDIVVPVPDSGISAAVGYAETSGIPFAEGFVKNRYVGRTFIQPEQALRAAGVDLKLSVLVDVVRGKRVVLVDDSIVRGTTILRLIRKLRAAGAVAIDLRVASPPIVCPCHFGIDTPSRGELIAAGLDVAAVCQKVDADSLAYLSIRGLREAVGGNGSCDACFSGQYPMEVPDEGNKLGLEQAEVEHATK
ncbi:amidophosphoribosyltransferase [Candidatus Cryosericum septentrionale]|jgi:amidophosphoribosyltransferase|nr:amidophosphoribosyltransferase [Candidatus Cryosericum septentrionale]